jgi:hypothetical protein
MTRLDGRRDQTDKRLLPSNPLFSPFIRRDPDDRSLNLRCHNEARGAPGIVWKVANPANCELSMQALCSLNPRYLLQLSWETSGRSKRHRSSQSIAMTICRLIAFK